MNGPRYLRTLAVNGITNSILSLSPQESGLESDLPVESSSSSRDLRSAQIFSHKALGDRAISFRRRLEDSDKPRMSVWRDFSKVLKEIRKPVAEQNRNIRVEPGTVIFTHFNDAYHIYSENGADVSRYAHLMKSVAVYAGGHALNTCGGDVLEGYALGRYFEGSHSIDIMNQMGIHFAVPGNHEFDQDPGLSQAKFGDSIFEWVVANLFLPHGLDISGTIRSTVVEQNGIKIGVMGLVGDWLADAKGSMNMIYGRAEKHAMRQIAAMKKDGAEVIVALTHMDIAFDRELAKLVPDIDIILGGHDHIPYAEFNEDTRTLILKSGCDWNHMGVVALKKREDGRVYVQYDIADVNGNLERDPEIFELTKYYQNAFDSVNRDRRVRVVTESLVPLETRGFMNRSRETTGGNLVADAFRQFGIHELLVNSNHHQKMFSQSGPVGITEDDIVAITNGGGIRSDVVFPPGDVTVGMADDMLPFPNRVTVLPLTGAAIRRALESGVERVEHLDGRFPQVSGIQFETCLTDPIGQRVKRIMINGTEINPDKIYFVMTNDYLAGGGNGYRAFLTGYDHAIKPRAFTQTMLDVLVWYLERSDQINPQLEDRIILLDPDHRRHFGQISHMGNIS